MCLEILIYKGIKIIVYLFGFYLFVLVLKYIYLEYWCGLIFYDYGMINYWLLLWLLVRIVIDWILNFFVWFFRVYINRFIKGLLNW